LTTNIRLEEENKALQTSLENSQAEIEDLRDIFGNVNLKQEAANTACERYERELKKLHRRLIKLECHSRRGNMKFFGIKEHDNETNSDTELAMRIQVHEAKDHSSRRKKHLFPQSSQNFVAPFTIKWAKS